MIDKISPTIAIIDSGIGGISILNQLIARFRVGNYIYFADNLYMPYGKIRASQLKKRLLYIISLLQTNYSVDKIIIACNTASAILSDMNLPNVNLLKFNENDTYLATSLTKNTLISSNVIADPTLAKLIERYIFEPKKMDKIIRQHVKKYKLDELKSLTLGCTHYELVFDLFQKYCPNTILKRNSDEIIDEITDVQSSASLNIEFITSKQSMAYIHKLNKLVGR